MTTEGDNATVLQLSLDLLLEIGAQTDRPAKCRRDVGGIQFQSIKLSMLKLMMRPAEFLRKISNLSGSSRLFTDNEEWKLELLSVGLRV